MDNLRVFLYAALAIVIYTLWMNWQNDYPAPMQQSQTAALDRTTVNNLLPPINGTLNPAAPKNIKNTHIKDSQINNVIDVKTDVMQIKIDLNYGTILAANLLHYPVSVEEKNQPIPILQDQADNFYVASSNLLVTEDQQPENINFHFHSSQQNYTLAPVANNLIVTLIGSTPEGLEVQKRFIFARDNYLILVQYIINNHGEKTWTGYLDTQLLRNSPTEDKSSIFHIGSYTGASYSNPEQSKYQKVTFANMKKNNLRVDVKSGWIAMQQHYFLTAWIPESNSNNLFYTRSSDSNYTIGAVSAPIGVEPKQSKTIATRLYIGPEITSNLQKIAPGLDLTIDYGWLWFLSSLLFSIMKAIYLVIGNWGWSIVLVTILIKIAFYHLSAKSYKSMAGMRKLQPKLQALRERYGEDKAKISQATMELYRQEKINPLGGCLPIIIQIPVFIALYWVLLESVELRQAPFVFWIKDLAIADPYHILPIIMGGTMFIQQKLNPAPPDPMQAKFMMLLPILFTALFWSFPAGLILYWIVNNTLSILQQWYITRKYSENKTKQLRIAK